MSRLITTQWVHRAEVLTNNSPTTLALFRALWRGEISKLLAADTQRVSAPRQRSARRLRPDELDALVAGYHSGGSVYELADRFKIGRTTVAEHLKARGVVMRNEVQVDEYARMVSLFEQGLSLNQIGREVGRDPKTVKCVLQHLGFKTPSRAAG